MCLLRVDDKMMLVREEAQRGIDMERFSSFAAFGDVKTENAYPQFKTVVTFAYVYMKSKLKATFNQFSSPNVHVAILQFLRASLEATTKGSMHDFVSSLETEQVADTNAFDAYGYILEHAFYDHANADLLFESATSLLQLITLNVDKYGAKFASSLGSKVVKYLFSGEDFSRERMAKLLAVLYMYFESGAKHSLLATLKPKLEPEDLLATESRMIASIHTLGYILALTYKKSHGLTPAPLELHGVLDDIIHLMDYSKPNVQASVFSALGEIGRQGALQSYISKDENAVPATKKRKIITNKQSILQLIGQKMKKIDNAKVLERLVTCLGMLSLGEDDESLLSEITTNLFSLADNKAEEIQFTVGESIAMLVGGSQYCSLLRTDDYSIIYGSSMKPNSTARNDFTKNALQRVIRELVLSPKKLVRQGASIWLLASVRYAGESPELKKYLFDLQRSFSILMSDNNEITQEVAGRGMAFVYELGDDSTRKTLVGSLVETLSGSKKAKEIKLSGESELLLFPEDTKKNNTGSTGPGTYKELCDVATDIGKPDMIYKLMQLSSSNTVWNTKRAAAFSAANIASLKTDAQEMKKILPQIVPKLFRYLFDPNAVISKAMAQLWRAIVDNPQQVIELYMKPIMKEILGGLNTDQWRVREACCNAVSELFSGRRFDDMEPYLADSLYYTFRVCDDVKESCQKAALSAVKKLGQFCIKICNPNYTPPEKVKRALDVLVPYFLEKGIHFPVKELVFFSIEHLDKICEAAGHLCRPHIAPIVGALLEHMSVLEPAVFNYIHLQAEKEQVDTEKLEQLRVSMASSGPLYNTITTCERFVTGQVLETLVPKLIDILRVGVGVATRAATARFLGNLGKFHETSVKAFAPRIIKAMMTAIESTTSSAERSQLASALPYILKCASSVKASKSLEEILNLYLNSTESEKRFISGLVMQNLAKHMPSLVKNYMEQVLPVIFIARNDPDEKVFKIWEQVWEETVTSSPKDTVRMYIQFVSEQCIKCINQSSWAMKKQGAKGLFEIGDLLSTDIPDVIKSKLMMAVLENSAGRIWEGKEVLMDAFGALATSFTQVPENILNKTFEVALREMKKNTKSYKICALRAFFKIISTPAFEQQITVAYYSEVSQMLQTELNTVPASNDDDISGDAEEEANAKREQDKEAEKVKVEIFAILAKLHPSPSLHFKEYLAATSESVTKLVQMLQTPHTVSELNAMLRGLEVRVLQLKQLCFVEKKAEFTSLLSVTDVLSCLLHCMDPAQAPIHVRVQAAHNMSTFVDLLKTVALPSSVIDTLRAKLVDIEKREKDYSQREKVQSIHLKQLPPII